MSERYFGSLIILLEVNKIMLGYINLELHEAQFNCRCCDEAELIF